MKARTKSTFTHVDKIFWPKEKYTKGDVIEYYEKLAPYILPYLKDRPMVMNRHPNGATKSGFFQKDSSSLNLPSFVKTATLRSETDNKKVQYVVCNNKETLLYLANLGCIEMNPFASRTTALHKPDFLIIDLDPSGNSFDEIVEVARELHGILKEIGITKSIPKTSGKKGMHVYIPLKGAYSYDVARNVAKLLGELLHSRLPKLASMEHFPAKRRGKIHPDYMRNALGQTAVAPYSLRPFTGATVSTPLEWSEIKKGLKPSQFTIRTIHTRLKKKGDLWKPALGAGANLKKALARLEKIVGT
ncbi:DNA polymerase LigD [Candidatus Kaiserbacteria bacterium]|nr:DNA polymerase LigD [Candidatus Kaiserbacteria bacterium]